VFVTADLSTFKVNADSALPIQFTTEWLNSATASMDIPSIVVLASLLPLLLLEMFCQSNPQNALTPMLPSLLDKDVSAVPPIT
jgi:hypothetical protein